MLEIRASLSDSRGQKSRVPSKKKTWIIGELFDVGT